jgi:hypothetical protein
VLQESALRKRLPFFFDLVRSCAILTYLSARAIGRRDWGVPVTFADVRASVVPIKDLTRSAAQEIIGIVVSGRGKPMAVADELQKSLASKSKLRSQQGRVIITSSKQREELQAKVFGNCEEFFRRLAEWREESMSRGRF